MKNKKIISMLTICVMMMSLLVGCGSNINRNQTNETDQESQSTSETENATDEERITAESEGGKTLVVYYSATGNTEAVTNTIAETMNADVFELEPAEPYSDDDLDWRDDSSRVSEEYENPESRDVKLIAATVDDWESYDTVFIGYPIWWGIAAWPVNEFIESNDFTGKTVVPFCTSISTGLGESGELLADMAETGNWLEGERFRPVVSEEDVQRWVESLGL